MHNKWLVFLKVTGYYRLGLDTKCWLGDYCCVSTDLLRWISVSIIVLIWPAFNKSLQYHIFVSLAVLVNLLLHNNKSQ